MARRKGRMQPVSRQSGNRWAWIGGALAALLVLFFVFGFGRDANRTAALNPADNPSRTIAATPASPSAPVPAPAQENTGSRSPNDGTRAACLPRPRQRRGFVFAAGESQEPLTMIP